ncbi:hypothetical protein NQ176_g4168 [Zarea fungicola]|uniref:Uncharacterized protein n=1 Tax=Zarea fungicola TaxID=93591 RepID=A0ACC1NEN8_9HYPO|nr:hypothetical protein NQ176_g4168 [Lecanicillium fungicola]
MATFSLWKNKNSQKEDAYLCGVEDERIRNDNVLATGDVEDDNLGNVSWSKRLNTATVALIVRVFMHFTEGSRYPIDIFWTYALSVKPLGGMQWAVSVTEGVAKAVELYVDTEDDEAADSYHFSDNALDLVPGDEQIVTVELKEGAKAPEGGIVIKERHYL